MIQFDRVTKVFPGGVKANDEVSFCLQPGEVLGIIGPNGSGKSTIFRQLFGIISTTSGKIIIDGKEKCLDNVSYAPQFPVIYPYLKVYESLETTLNYQKISKKEILPRVNDTLKKFNLWDIRNYYSYTLSGGQRKKLSFINALIQDRKYLILDEVSSMMDPISKQEIWKTIIELKKAGKGILISSHDIAEIKTVCDKILVLKKGSVQFYGKIEDIYSQVSKITISIDEPKELLGYLETMGIDFQEKDTTVNLYINDKIKAIDILEDILTRFPVKHYECEQPVFYEGVLKHV